jgi:hypothetical protein
MPSNPSGPAWSRCCAKTWHQVIGLSLAGDRNAHSQVALLPMAGETTPSNLMYLIYLLSDLGSVHRRANRARACPPSNVPRIDINPQTDVLTTPNHQTVERAENDERRPSVGIRASPCGECEIGIGAVGGRLTFLGAFSRTAGRR